MNKNQPLLDHISSSGVETITLQNQEIYNILGLQLPKTALNYRMFWENSKNRTRVQNLLGLSSSYPAKLNSKKELLFSKKGK